jgi:hypothetical protein
MIMMIRFGNEHSADPAADALKSFSRAQVNHSRAAQAAGVLPGLPNSLYPDWNLEERPEQARFKAGDFHLNGLELMAESLMGIAATMQTVQKDVQAIKGKLNITA